MIQKAYRRRVVQTHPDKTDDDRRAFDKVAKAYEVLSDDSKRRIYNRHGTDGLEQQQPPGFPTEDFFRSFFGTEQQAPPRRNRTMRYQLEVTLEDLYHGMTKTVQVQGPSNMFTRSRQTTSITLASARIIHKQTTTKNSQQQHSDNTDDSILPPLLINTGDVQVLKGRGMPKDPHGLTYGDLYVQFHVDMPKSSSNTDLLTDEVRKELSRLLNKLDGKIEAPTTTTTTSSTESIMKDDTSNNKSTSNITSSNKQAEYLRPVLLSDFGRASGRPNPPKQQGDEEEFGGNPFGSSAFGGGGRRFYWSSSSSGGGDNPFSGGDPFGGDDAETRCLQM
jgi:DnaJ-class molecular chaperone